MSLEKFHDTRSVCKKQLHFYVVAMNNSKMILRKNSIHNNKIGINLTEKYKLCTLKTTKYC